MCVLSLRVFISPFLANFCPQCAFRVVIRVTGWNTTAYSPICLGGHGWLHLRADFHWSKLPVWLGSHEIGKYEGIKSESFQFIFYILSLAIERGIAPICLKLIFFSLKYQRSDVSGQYRAISSISLFISIIHGLKGNDFGERVFQLHRGHRGTGFSFSRMELGTTRLQWDIGLKSLNMAM